MRDPELFPAPVPPETDAERERRATYSLWIGEGETWRTLGKLRDVFAAQAVERAVKVSRRTRRGPNLCRSGERVRVWRDAAHALDGEARLIGTAYLGRWADGESTSYLEPPIPTVSDEQYLAEVAAAVWSIRALHMCGGWDPDAGRVLRNGSWFGVASIRYELEIRCPLERRPPADRIGAFLEQLERRGWLHRHPNGRPRWRVMRAMLSAYSPPETTT